MPPRVNPLRLNNLQLKTLAVIQELARSDHGRPAAEDGSITIDSFPGPHGDHFHIGDAVVQARDCTGFTNPAVLNALARRGLIRPGEGGRIVLTSEGQAYDTGPAQAILRREGG